MDNHYDQSFLNKSRKDKFSLTVTLPEALRTFNKKLQRDNNTVDIDTLQFSVYGTIVPKNIVPAEEVRYAGAGAYVSSHVKPTYDPISVKFTIDNEFKNYWFIHKWIDLIRNEKTGIYNGPITEKDNGPGLYSADFCVTAKDEFHGEVIQWIYKNAFPISIGEIDYNYRDAAEIETTFEFVFRRIETILL
jgi:hypothetical protein